MNEVLIGMAVQAFVTATLWQCGIIIPSPEQQILACVFFIIFRWLYLKSEERKTRRISATLLITTMLIAPASPAYSYVLPVIDVANLAPNTTTSLATTLTAEQMMLQVRNSNEEVAMMKQNLVPGGGDTWDDLINFLRRIDQVLGEGNALHYQLANLKQLMSARFPGYINPGKSWIPAYELATQTSLDTLRGILMTAREQLKLAERTREEINIAELRENSRRANGNLAVQQAGNAINLQFIEEARKMRQLTGASMNAQNVAMSNQINLQAAGDKVFADWIEKSQIPVVAYSGRGGFGPGSVGW